MEFTAFDISPVASMSVNDSEQEELFRIALRRRPGAAGGRSENPATIYFAPDKPHSQKLTNRLFTEYCDIINLLDTRRVTMLQSAWTTLLC